MFETVTRLPATWSRHVYCLGPERPLAGKFRSRGVGVTCFNAKPSGVFSAVAKFRGGLRRTRPNVLQTWLFHANIVGRIAAAGLGLPVIATHRVAEHRAGWHVRLERMTGRLVTRHAAVSRSVADFLRERDIAEAATVITNGVVSNRLKPHLGGGGLVAAGRLTRQKGFDTLIEAMRTVHERHPSVPLTVYGEGPDRPLLEKLAATLRRPELIRLPGRVESLADAYAAADAFVLSSRWEGMPNVLLEAVAAGVPIVATDTDGVREVLGPRVSLPLPDDPESLALEICRVLDDPVSAQKGAAETQTAVSNEFTWERAAERTARLLVDTAAMASRNR